MRNLGIIMILVGIGVLLMSIIFSSGDRSNLSLIGNMHRMEIVLQKGKYVRHYPKGTFLRAGTGPAGHYEGRVAIPLKYSLSMSVLFILLGAGIVLIPKKTKL